MSKRKRNRPDIEKLRYEIRLLKGGIDILTKKANEAFSYNENTMKEISEKFKELIHTERDKAIKILKTYQTRERTFIRRFLSWFGI